eukprot:m.963106 g.963106  ORF g.963106 m.963106 type:complete len:779 (+) comp23893_c0_seq16:237-2573(+)
MSSTENTPQVSRTKTTLTRDESFRYSSDEDEYTDTQSEQNSKGERRRESASDDGESYYSDGSSEYTSASESEYSTEYTESATGDESYYTEHDYEDRYDDASLQSDPSFMETEEKRQSRTKFPPIHRTHTSPQDNVTATHKTITVYRNGDAHFPGRTVIVGPTFRSFDYLLDWITTRIRSPFGAVRRLFELPSGTPVTSLEALEDGRSYVAAKQEKLQRLPYTQILDYNTRQRTYMAPNLAKLKYKQREVKGRNAVEHPITIFCLANRDQDGVTTKVILKARDRTSMSHVLDIITERLGYRKLPAVAKKLIDMETLASVTKLHQIEHGHFYVAIDRPDAVVMPPFRVHPQTRAIIPVVQESKRKVRNMPIMFDGPIRGKIDCGERIIEKREARGYRSQVGRVTLQRRPVPKELPPIKQPFPQQLHITQADEAAHDSLAHVVLKRTPQDKAIWRIIHKYIDELTAPLVEETLKEMYDTIYQLLNNLVVMRTTEKAPGRNPRGEQSIVESPEPPPPKEVRPAPKMGKTSHADVGHEAAAADVRHGRNADRTPPEQQQYDYTHDAYVDVFLETMVNPRSNIWNEETDDRAAVQLRKRFEAAMEAALQRKLMHWQRDPTQLVALVILLDQIPRKFYAGSPDQYNGDEMSRDVINSALQTDVISQVIPSHILFICVALSHQEDMESQKCVGLYTATAHAAWIHTHPNPYTRAHMHHSPTRTPALMHSISHTHAYPPKCIQIHTHAYPHTHLRIYPRPHSRFHTHKHATTHIPTPTCIHQIFPWR